MQFQAPPLVLLVLGWAESTFLTCSQVRLRLLLPGPLLRVTGLKPRQSKQMEALRGSEGSQPCISTSSL